MYDSSNNEERYGWEGVKGSGILLKELGGYVWRVQDDCRRHRSVR